MAFVDLEQRGSIGILTMNRPEALNALNDQVLRDLDADRATAENYDEVMERMNEYLGEFQRHGTDHVTVELEE